MDYHISFQNPNTHYITIKATFITKNAHEEILLPNWRPGRYQIQNFAKRIRSIRAFDKNGDQIGLEKHSKSSWRLANQPGSMTIIYQYYAFEMDAGNSWLDDEQLYVNFINCCIYTKESLNEHCTVSFDLPEHYEIASGLKRVESNRLFAEDYYRLVDSPMFASASLRKISYSIKGYSFVIWIQGDLPKTDEEVTKDFSRFTALQIGIMGEFPCPEYHFLLQCLPYKHYHGVEHWNSTVITIGPSKALADRDRYKDLLGVSSHELFHTWNVIRLRPKEMMPYDFQNENYHETGFVTEGVTTYYGDLFLVRSGVFSLEEYLQELNKLLKRHYENEGRTNLSVAKSSFDLWLDGYERGIPGRKVSIYNEGALAALILDLMIRAKFNNAKSLDDVMRLMWFKHGKDQSGYTFLDYQSAVESVYAESLDDYFKNIISGSNPLEDYLSGLLPKFGLNFSLSASEKVEETVFGFRLSEHTISDIASGSPAYEKLSIGDKLVSINGRSFKKELLDSNPIKLEIDRYGRSLEVNLIPSEVNYFSIYQVSKENNTNGKSLEMLYGWLQN